MAQPTILLLVRHGETHWNLEGRQQGHRDSSLSARGVAQAKAIAAAMATQPFDALYSSDLGRAMATARFISQRTGCRIVPDPLLRERNLGIFEGLTWPQVLERHPAAVAAFQTGDPDYVIPGGESARQRFERTTRRLTDLAAIHAGQRIVVVAHGGVLDGMYRLAEGIDVALPRSFKLRNASINTFAFNAGTWHTVTWGCTDHLGNLESLDDR